MRHGPATGSCAATLRTRRLRTRHAAAAEVSRPARGDVRLSSSPLVALRSVCSVTFPPQMTPATVSAIRTTTVMSTMIAMIAAVLRRAFRRGPSSSDCRCCRGATRRSAAAGRSGRLRLPAPSGPGRRRAAVRRPSVRSICRRRPLEVRSMPNLGRGSPLQQVRQLQRVVVRVRRQVT